MPVQRAARVAQKLGLERRLSSYRLGESGKVGFHAEPTAILSGKNMAMANSV